MPQLVNVCKKKKKVLIVYDDKNHADSFKFVLSSWGCHWSFRDYVYVRSQWETTLQCNVVSHWLRTYATWSLIFVTNQKISMHQFRQWLGNGGANLPTSHYSNERKPRFIIPPMASPGFSELNQPVTVSTQWLMQPELIDGIDRLISFYCRVFSWSSLGSEPLPQLWGQWWWKSLICSPFDSNGR